MIPSYYRPTSVAEAVELKARFGTGAAFLAGGTEVNSIHFRRPSALIDISSLGLGTLSFSPKGVRIGAAVTFQQLIEHPQTPMFLKAAALQMTNRNIRNCATVGGHLGSNRSCADLIPAFLAAETQIMLPGCEMPIERYLESPQDLILSIFVPATERSFGLYHQTRTASDLSIITAAASLTLENKCIRLPILAIGGVARHVIRVHEVEKALEGRPLATADEVESLIAHAVDPINDLRGSADYKRHLAAVLGYRALRAAVNHLVSADGGC